MNKLSPAEKTQLKEDRRLVKALEAVLTKFMKKFRSDPADVKADWRWRGWELMQKIEKYCLTNSEIETMQVSDRDHSISMLVLIPHYDATTKWMMGTTVIHVPQNLDETPQSFFITGNKKEFFKFLKESES